MKNGRCREQGTSSEIKEQYEKKKSLRGSFFISPLVSIFKNIGGKKEKNENEKQNDSDGGNSGSAVFDAVSGYTCDCR
jgi:hypothetical protein